MLSRRIFVLLFILLPKISFAGGVSTGGGGTTIPDPVESWQVAQSLKDFNVIILPWLKRQQEFFEVYQDATEKAASAFQPLFGKSPSVFDRLKDLQIEIKMHAPCLDVNGNPWDGSYRPNQPTTVCISAFSMAPKLSDRTVHAETLALLIHEISHMCGADEKQADEIQQLAINDLSRIDLWQAKHDFQNMLDWGGALSIAKIRLEILITASAITAEGVRNTLRDISDAHEMLAQRYSRLLFTTPALANLVIPNYYRLHIADSFLCANNANETPEMRAYCQSFIDKGFLGGATATAREYVARTQSSGVAANLGTEFDAVVLINPQSPADLRLEFKEVLALISSIIGEVRETSNWTPKFL